MDVLEHFLNKIKKDNYNLHSCLIYYQGKMLYEGYGKPFSKEHQTMLYSVSKSFVSIAIGYLVEEEKISLEDSVLKYFDEIKPTKYLNQITIRDLLTMQSGSNHEQNILISSNWIEQYFMQDFNYLPGTHFHYNSMNTYILSVIVTKVTHQKLVDYLDVHLFKPLKIKKPRFDEDALGYNIGGWGLYLTPSDLMCISIAFMHNHPTFPLNYKHEMTTLQANSNSKNGSKYYRQGYGYQCWMNGENLGYRFDGVFGQFVIMVPTLDLIVVTSASLLLSDQLLNTIFEDFIKLLPGNVSKSNLKLPSLILPNISEPFDYLNFNNFYYKFKSNSSSIFPLAIIFLKHFKITYASGYKFHFFNEYILLDWYEEDCVNHICIGINKIVKPSYLLLNNERFLIQAYGYFKKSKLYVTIVFLEFPHIRKLRFDFLTKKKIAVNFDETPSVDDLIGQYHYLLTFTPFSALNNWAVEQAYHLINPISISFRQKKKEA